MDQFADKQKKIDQRRLEVSALYASLWSNMITEWKRPGAEGRVWLTYSANYPFRTNNICWAIDPLTLNWRIKDAPKVNVVRDLCNLSFVLLTHRHADHLDIELLSALRHLPITWVVPEFILPEVMKQAGLPRNKIITPSPFVPFEINGMHILPFSGLHWEIAQDGTRKGVPALGYLIEFNGMRWLFRGTRAPITYPNFLLLIVWMLSLLIYGWDAVRRYWTSIHYWTHSAASFWI